MEVPRLILVTFCYAVIIFLTGLCMYINLIFGVKFTKEQQTAWVTATYIGLLLDWGVYSTSQIILQWLLPQYITEILFIFFIGGILAFGVFCGEIMDPATRPWTQDLQFVCDVLP